MGGNRVFNQRLKRIAAQNINTNATFYVGVDETFQLPGPPVLQPSPAPRVGLGSIVLALLSGMVAWIWAHWLRLGLVSTADPLMQQLAVTAFGLAGLGLLAAILGLRGWRIFALQGLGLLFAKMMMHNAVQVWPETFALIFPPNWIFGMLAITEPVVLPLAPAIL